MRKRRLVAALELTLKSGRRIQASSLHVSMTYYALLEGAPDAEQNDRRIAKLPDEVRRILGKRSNVLLVEPRRKPVELQGRFHSRSAEYLPDYWIAGNFWSSRLERDDDESQLTLVWFQDRVTPSLSDHVPDNLLAIDWDANAQGWIW